MIYRNDRQKLRNPFPASKTHFIFQLKTRTFVRPNVRRNERTNAHTHTLVTVMPLSWCLACGGDLGFGSARETVRPAGLLHTHTFLFHQDKHETCKRSLTHRSGSRGVLTHSHHPHTPPPMLAHNIYPPQHLSKQEPFHTASQRIRTCRSVGRKKHERSKQRQYSSV